MKAYLVTTMTIGLLVFGGCARSDELQSASTIVKPVELNQDGVAVIEKYFQAIEKDRRDEAEILLSRLSEKKRSVNIEELDVNRLNAVQSKHSAWFTYFRDEGFKLERVATLGGNTSKLEIRAFCSSPAGDHRIPQVVDFELIIQDGKTVIQEITPNIAESLREVKNTRPT